MSDKLHQSVVCSGFLLVYSDCNTFLLSVCVRSSELQRGVHFSVSTSPRVILVGTVVRAAASFVFKVCIDSAKTASNSDVAAAVLVAGYNPQWPSQKQSLKSETCKIVTAFRSSRTEMGED